MLGEVVYFVEVDVGEGCVEFFVEVYVMQFDCVIDCVLWQLGVEVFVDFVGMQVFGDIVGEVQFGVGGGDIQQLFVQWCVEFFFGDFCGDWLVLFDVGVVGVVVLVVEYFGGKGGLVVGNVVVFVELYWVFVFLGDMYVFVEGFDVKCFVILQEMFVGVGDEFVQCDYFVVVVDVYQEVLEVLVVIGKGDQQGVVVILQQVQVGLDFYGGFEYFWGLWFCFFDEWVGYF